MSASFDRNGRYAFGKQADTCKWNLCRLAEAFQLIGEGLSTTAEGGTAGGDDGSAPAPAPAAAATDADWAGVSSRVVDRVFDAAFDEEYQRLMLRKLGFATPAPVLPLPAADPCEQEGALSGSTGRLDSELVSATRALLHHGMIGLHDFFTELAQYISPSWVEGSNCADEGDAAGLVLAGASFAASAHALAGHRRWAAFTRLYSRRLTLASSRRGACSAGASSPADDAAAVVAAVEKARCCIWAHILPPGLYTMDARGGLIDQLDTHAFERLVDELRAMGAAVQRSSTLS